MIISFLSQKGGVGKSTLARGVAVEFVKNGWDTHIADMDTTQQSTVQWAERRDAIGVEPSIDAAMYRNPQSALRSTGRCDLLVIDGTPYATQDTKDLAARSDLVVIPTGITHDDLEPSLRLAQELTMKAGVSKSKILMVVMKVPESGDKEAMSTKSSIKDWGFAVIDSWMPFRTAYGKAMDAGYSMSETRFNTLNDRAGSILSAIAERATQEVDNG
jgi:chromosome partitioning protein